MAILKEKIKKILVISLQGIGDLLLFTPCLPVLKRNFPNAKISMLILHYTKEIIENNPYIGNIMIYHYHPTKVNYFEILKLLVKLRKEKFNLVICSFPTGLRSALIAYLAGIDIRCGHRYTFIKKLPFLFNMKVDIPKLKHVIDLNLDLLSALGIDITKVDKKLFIPLMPQDTNFVIKFLQRNNISNQDLLIGINPGTDVLKKEKCWPKEKFIRLIERLIRQFKAKVVLIGGRSERSLSIEIASIFKTNIVDATGIMSLKQTAALIEKCNLFIGNDSGLIHISVAMNTPTIAIFGPTDPRLYKPYGPKHVVIRKGLECSPCAYGVCGNLELIERNIGFNKGTFRCEKGTFECIKSIEVKEVFDAARNIILNLKKHNRELKNEN